MTHPDLDIVDDLCEVMHDAYEVAAIGAGWETQSASRKPWADVPEANKATMRVAVLALLTRLRALEWAPEPGSPTLLDDLRRIINRHSRENASNTPDHLLAAYLLTVLEAAEELIGDRAKWYGRMDEPGGPPLTLAAPAAPSLTDPGAATGQRWDER